MYAQGTLCACCVICISHIHREVYAIHRAGKPPELKFGTLACRAPSQAQKLLARMEREGRPINPTMKRLIESLDEMDDQDVPLVKPGDASMAAPFTAKHDSVMPCTDLIKQGRCTLVSTVQMFKILGLMSLSSAYSLSVMYLQGVKIGDVQVSRRHQVSFHLFPSVVIGMLLSSIGVGASLGVTPFCLVGRRWCLCMTTSTAPTRLANCCFAEDSRSHQA